MNNQPIRRSLRLVISATAALALLGVAYAADDAGAAPTGAPSQVGSAKPSDEGQQIRELKKQLEQEQKQIDALSKRLKSPATSTDAPDTLDSYELQQQAETREQIKELQAMLTRQQDLLERLELSARKSSSGSSSSSVVATDTAPASSQSGTAYKHGATLASLRGLLSSGGALDPLPTPTPGAQAKEVPATQLENSISLAQGKLQIGGLIYADWVDYYKSGFGPQFLTQINQEGPGNNGFNSFDINRAYINLLYSPNDNVTFRITPNIYRQFAGGLAAEKVGSVTGIPASADQNLSYRLKYGYADFKNLFKHSKMASGLLLTVGQMQNPLIDWEESLWTYRYVSLVPWNYLSLSSTQTGFALRGPLKGANGKTYLDFNAGIFTQASFHAYEQAETKQVMARATVYPFGSATAFESLGITGFFDYGYSNAPPSTARVIPTYRGVAMVHYGTKNNMSNIGFEYDFGRNAFSAGNLFSGSGPLDQFGLGTTVYANMDNVAKAILGVDSAKQQGFNVFGHLQLGKTPLQLFGWFENFNPNTELSKDPIEFNRIIGGLQVRISKGVRMAFDFQNLIFTHSQYTMDASDIRRFSSSLASANPTGISNVVPGNLQSFFINMEFSF